MRARGKLALAVVIGGVALGAVLGAAANPEMRGLPERARHGVPPPPIVAVDAYQPVEAGPEDLGAYWSQDSYAPAYASGAIEDWEPDYPAWTYSDFGADDGEQQAGGPPIDAGPESSAPSTAAPEPVAPEVLPPRPRRPDTLGALY